MGSGGSNFDPGGVQRAVCPHHWGAPKRMGLTGMPDGPKANVSAQPSQSDTSPSAIMEGWVGRLGPKMSRAHLSWQKKKKKKKKKPTPHFEPPPPV